MQCTHQKMGFNDIAKFWGEGLTKLMACGIMRGRYGKGRSSLNIGIIDAEIMGKSKHRFPNLVCMKISSFYKSRGDNVTLLLDYNDVDNYDKVFLSKVFIKTEIPCEPDDKSLKNEQTVVEYYKDNEFLKKPNLEYGGTGFYYEKAPRLSIDIEHTKPDYHLYDEWVANCIKNGAKEKEFTYYTDYSIGFLTRGCFRQCQFCVNKVYKQCVAHSNLSEFMDNDRKKLCFLDDNFFACSNWREIIQEVLATKKRFQFKQGLDERLLNKERVDSICEWQKKYDGQFIFAFDNIEDKDLIVSKLELLYSLHPEFHHQTKFYVFCGYDRNDVYDEKFWLKDIRDLFDRIFTLARYSAFPYIMRHENYHKSPYAQLYDAIASWCNQPSIFKTFSFREFCRCKGMKPEGYKKYKRDWQGYLKEYGTKYSCWRALDSFVEKHGSIFDEQFDTCPPQVAIHGAWVKR